LGESWNAGAASGGLGPTRSNTTVLRDSLLRFLTFRSLVEFRAQIRVNTMEATPKTDVAWFTTKGRIVIPVWLRKQCFTRSHRPEVASSSSPVPSAGCAAEDRPGRKPGFTDPPAARAPAGRQNSAAPAALPARIVRRQGEETGSFRFPFLVFLSSLRRTSSGSWGDLCLTRSREG
jgi:hypothetical protein